MKQRYQSPSTVRSYWTATAVTGIALRVRLKSRIGVARLGVGVLGFAIGLGTATAADTIPADGGNIELTVIRHAHVQMEFGGKVIHVDPWAGPATFAVPLPASFKPADIILITDIHTDHLHQSSIDRVKKATTVFVAPSVVAGSLSGNTTVMSNGETKVVEGINIQALPAYNMVRGSSNGPYHTKGRANAYLLTLGGKRVLVAGDTECVPEIKSLTNIDVAFIPVNLPFTMAASEAADCVKVLKPKIVYPYHYLQPDAQPPNKNQMDFAAAMQGTPDIEVRIRDFYSR